ncbi:MAG: MlaE family lipid ABC transporter permease subunit [Myxococcota bacterium]
MNSIQLLGRRSLLVVQTFGQMGVFAVRLVSATLTPPLRFRRFIDETFNVGVLSLPIVCTCGAAVGLALGLQGYNTLTRFGAEEALGALVGLSLVRELGPVLTSLLVTGRAGSAIASEIGSMVATEQLDGLRMMSVDPVDFVATPKAASMVLAMPLLSALFIVFGLLGSWLIGVQVLGIDHGAFVGGLESAIDFSDDILGSLLKALVFGLLVGLIATYRGYTSAPNVEGVSRATTGAVVQASVGTLIMDYFITALWGV